MSAAISSCNIAFDCPKQPVVSLYGGYFMGGIPCRGGGSHQCFKDSKDELNAVIIEDITAELWFINQVVLPAVFSAAPI